MEGRRTRRKREREREEGERRRKKKEDKLRRKSETGGPERIIIHNHI